jgi:hypothetical protein
MDSKIIFWGGSAYALRGYGVTLGSSSSHDPFFSRAAASEGSMTVSGVQAVGVMGAILRGGGAVQPWVKPTEAPGVMRWRRCRANGSAAARCPLP